MPKISLEYDLSDVKSGFDPLPTDQYPAKVTEVQLTRTKNTDKAMLVFVWTVTEGEYTGRNLYDNVVLDVAWKVKQYAELAGVEEGSELDTRDFEGLEAVLDIEYLAQGEKGAPPGRDGNRIKNMLAVD